jgi:hypothetical protein
MVITVTDAMTARFADEMVHPVYGTAALVRHMEQVSRRLLVPGAANDTEGRARHPLEPTARMRHGENPDAVTKFVTIVLRHQDAG